MKDLKKNIQKNNMKKLVLSVTLGMFCYCINNATMSQKTTKPIDDVLKKMIIYQDIILRFKEKIEKGVKGKIYSAIKGKEEKINKKNVLDFIKKHFTNEKPTREDIDDDDINKIEQYFHLDKLGLMDECKKENLTEIFWTAPGNELGGEVALTDDDKNSIKDYFNTIIEMEKKTSWDFKEYYAMKKRQKPEAQDEDILKEIMKDCCGNEKKGYNIVTNFLLNLENLYEKNNIKNSKEKTVAAIKRRITLSNDTAKEEEDFISFLKQKIRKEEYPCCNCQKNCLKKKKNLEGDLSVKSEEEKLEGEGRAQKGDENNK